MDYHNASLSLREIRRGVEKDDDTEKKQVDQMHTAWRRHSCGVAFVFYEIPCPRGIALLAENGCQDDARRRIPPGISDFCSDFAFCAGVGDPDSFHPAGKETGMVFLSACSESGGVWRNARGHH